MFGLGDDMGAARSVAEKRYSMSKSRTKVGCEPPPRTVTCRSDVDRDRECPDGLGGVMKGIKEREGKSLLGRAISRKSLH